MNFDENPESLSGRRFLLCDVDADYVRLGRKRLGLDVEDLPVVRIEPAQPKRTGSFLCADSLEGVHPDDVAYLADHFNAIRSSKSA